MNADQLTDAVLRFLPRKSRDAVRVMTPEHGVAVVHAPLGLGQRIDLREHLSASGTPGIRYVIAHGPLIAGAWIGSDVDVPLCLLSREVLGSLQVWMDRLEGLARDEIAWALERCQPLIIRELEQRRHRREPYEWPGLSVNIGAPASLLTAGARERRLSGRVRGPLTATAAPPAPTSPPRPSPASPR